MYLKTIDFSKYSSIKIGQPVEVLMIERGDSIPADRFLVGGANNLLVTPTPPPLMMLSKDFSYIESDGATLTIGAATPTGRIVSYARKHDIGGFEFLAKLPGTLGGVLAMNAGVKAYEVFNILDSIEIDGEWREKGSIEHGYRFARLGGCATAAKFPIVKGFDKALQGELAKLRSNQPSDPSAGSAFKNPPGDAAGRLIDAVGLKGMEHGGMAWSSKHANFLVNLGGGTYEDAKYLIDLAREKVKAEFGIELELEVQIV